MLVVSVPIMVEPHFDGNQETTSAARKANVRGRRLPARILEDNCTIKRHTLARLRKSYNSSAFGLITYCKKRI